MILTIYTDGSCKPNPGPGGWAAIAYSGKRRVQEISGHQALSTNNRMELVAVGRALRDVDFQGYDEVVIVTDSQNVCGWLTGKYKRNDPTIATLCEKIDALIAKSTTKVSFKWVRGHDTDPANHEVDELANEARIAGIGRRTNVS